MATVQVLWNKELFEWVELYAGDGPVLAGHSEHHTGGDSVQLLLRSPGPRLFELSYIWAMVFKW